ncbi:MAG TPA: hypothetical protein VM554_03600 [Acidisarcina sp.]|nr:hypothetical protein [Acidisarcina sp.]
MENLLDTSERLNARLEDLERRVSALEHTSEVPRLAAAQPTSSNGTLLPATDALPLTQVGGLTVVGRAMLGMAGAYLLRAAAESSSFPKLAIVILAFAYVGMWLGWAAWVPVEAWFARATYASTSALILASMLWELTLSFKVLPTWGTAGVLAAFVIAGNSLAWKRHLTSIVWATNLAGVLAAFGLFIGTHDMVPFLSALLLMSLISEYAADRDRWLGVRPLVALVTDVAISALIYIYSNPEVVHTDYKNISRGVLLAPGCILLLIYGSSICYRTMLRRQRVSFFEVGQAMISFLLAAMSALYFGSSFGLTALGVGCLLFAAIGYSIVFLYFDGIPDHRNYQVYAAGSVALAVVGAFLCLPHYWLPLCLSIAAVAAIFLGARRVRLTLEYHGLVYLAGAAYASGLLFYATRALAGTFPARPPWIVWVVSIAAILCYAVAGRFQAEQWKQRLLELLSAALAVSATVTILVTILVWVMAVALTIDITHVAVIRTLTTCGVALVIAFSSSRWRRIELVWIAYAILVFVAAKLLFEDLAHGHPGFIAASFFLYAVTLILVPRMVRLGHRV